MVYQLGDITSMGFPQFRQGSTITRMTRRSASSSVVSIYIKPFSPAAAHRGLRTIPPGLHPEGDRAVRIGNAVEIAPGAVPETGGDG